MHQLLSHKTSQKISKNFSKGLNLFSALLLASCGGGSVESDSSNFTEQRPAIPTVLYVSGKIPSGLTPTITEFGGSRLVSITFASSLKPDPSYSQQYLNWAKHTKQEIQSPDTKKCLPEGLEISYLPKTDQSEIHLWAWEKVDTSICQEWFQEALTKGLAWKLYDVAADWGTVSEITIELKPAPASLTE